MGSLYLSHRQESAYWLAAVILINRPDCLSLSERRLCAREIYQQRREPTLLWRSLAWASVYSTLVLLGRCPSILQRWAWITSMITLSLCSKTHKSQSIRRKLCWIKIATRLRENELSCWVTHPDSLLKKFSALALACDSFGGAESRIWLVRQYPSYSRKVIDADGSGCRLRCRPTHDDSRVATSVGSQYRS